MKGKRITGNATPDDDVLCFRELADDMTVMDMDFNDDFKSMTLEPEDVESLSSSMDDFTRTIMDDDGFDVDEWMQRQDRELSEWLTRLAAEDTTADITEMLKRDEEEFNEFTRMFLNPES